jgi:4-carboxymuconolactone decarboxylase
MRLPIISPAELNAEQKPLYDDMRDGIAKNFQGLVNIRDDGALLGPWNPWIHEPKFGKPVWELTKAMVSIPSLPAPVREVAILVTGAHFKSAYELYAHVMVAEHRGLSDEKLATIVAGQRPNDLTRQEAVAYDFASALVNEGLLPELTYRAAVEQFGKHGAAELSYLVGLYCLVSVTLNTFDVPVPDWARATTLRLNPNQIEVTSDVELSAAPRSFSSIITSVTSGSSPKLHLQGMPAPHSQPSCYPMPSRDGFRKPNQFQSR